MRDETHDTPRTALAQLRFEAGALSINQLARLWQMQDQSLWRIESGEAKRLARERVAFHLNARCGLKLKDAQDLVGNRAHPTLITALAKHVRKALETPTSHRRAARLSGAVGSTSAPGQRANCRAS